MFVMNNYKAYSIFRYMGFSTHKKDFLFEEHFIGFCQKKKFDMFKGAYHVHFDWDRVEANLNHALYSITTIEELKGYMLYVYANKECKEIIKLHEKSPFLELIKYCDSLLELDEEHIFLKSDKSLVIRYREFLLFYSKALHDLEFRDI